MEGNRWFKHWFTEVLCTEYWQISVLGESRYYFFLVFRVRNHWYPGSPTLLWHHVSNLQSHSSPSSSAFLLPPLPSPPTRRQIHRLWFYVSILYHFSDILMLQPPVAPLFATWAARNCLCALNSAFYRSEGAELGWRNQTLQRSHLIYLTDTLYITPPFPTQV